MSGNWLLRAGRPNEVTRILAGLFLILIVTGGCANDSDSGVTQDGGSRSPSEEAGGAATPKDEAAATSGASCVTTFSPDELAKRAFAFDGTVAEVTDELDPNLEDDGSGIRPQPRALFEVAEWFAGGSDRTVWVWLQRDVSVGERLLVSGQPRWGGEPLDDAIQWECGFTVEYSEQDATQWREATS